MQSLIEENIKKFMRKSYHNRRILTATGEDFPTLIRSVDNGYTPIKFPTQTEGETGERIFDLPEIPYLAKRGDMPLMLFRGSFPTNSDGAYMTDPKVLAEQRDTLLVEGHDYILSGSRERPTAVKLLKFAAADWDYEENGQTKHRDIHFYYYGLGSVLTADDMYNFFTKNLVSTIAEITQLAVKEFFADNINIANLIVVKDGKCEVHDTTEIGTIKMWGNVNSPKNIEGKRLNYRECNGDTVTRSQYPALFEAWNVSGDSLVLPDLRGRFPIGHGTINDEFGGQKILAARSTGGEWKHKITIDEMPEHSHNINFGRHDGDGTYKDTSFLTPDTSGAPKDRISSTGGNQPMSLLPAYCAVTFIVRVK